jgi:acetyl-CoA carboxylase alpha subunit
MMRVTAAELAAFGIVDEVIAEPPGGAHEEPAETMAALGEAMVRWLRLLRQQVTTAGIDRLLDQRFAKYRQIGRWSERQAVVLSGAS